MAFYANIQQATTVPFEIVFTGPTPPTFALPENFRFIQTSVKPAQAMEAASRACIAPYLVQAVDDIKFSTGALDLMFRHVARADRRIATCAYWLRGGPHTISQTEGIFGSCGEHPRVASNAPLQPVCPMLFTEDWRDSGGIDTRFCAQYGDLDVYLRLIARGWQAAFVDASVEEAAGGSDLWRTKGQRDLRECRRIWRDDNHDWTPHRRELATAYDAATILTVDQGTVF